MSGPATITEPLLRVAFAIALFSGGVAMGYGYGKRVCILESRGQRRSECNSCEDKEKPLAVDRDLVEKLKRANEQLQSCLEREVNRKVNIEVR